MKNMSFTKKMMLALCAGLITGIGAIFLREQLMNNGLANVWQTINNLLFADISQQGNEQAFGLFYIIGQLFLRALQLVLIPLIFTSIVKAIQHIHDTKLLSKLASKTFINFIALSSIALILGTIVGFTAYNMGLFQLANLDGIEIVSNTTAGGNPLMVIVKAINPNLIATLGDNGSVLAVVVLGLLVGIGFQTLGDKIVVLRKIVNEIHDLTMTFLTFIITKVGPFAIFALLTRTFAAYGVDYLQPAIVYMILTSLTLLFFVGIICPAIVSIFAKVSPYIFIKKMYKVAVFGFSTSSSAASLPLTQETIINELGVDESIASFIVPLASTLNMTGTAIMQVIATLFIAGVAGYSVGIVELLAIIALAFIGSISTPAAPGAGAILLFTIISGMGYSNPAALAAYSFILAINRPVEMLVTAVNVIDDSVSSVIIGQSLGLLDEKIYNDMGTDAVTEVKKQTLPVVE